MKRQKSALRAEGEHFIKTSREQYNESSSFSNNLRKRQSFRASREREKLNSDKVNRAYLESKMVQRIVFFL